MIRAMTPREIVALRLVRQGIATPAGGRGRSPGEAVAALGAVQGQDYPGSLWSVGLRCPGATEGSVERALAERAIVRTWLLRGTLHLLAPADLRWLLALLAARNLAGNAGRQRQLGLDDAVLARSERLAVRTLEGGRSLTRDSLYELLENAGIATSGQRGYHITWWLAQRGVLCFGPREGRQPTFVLLEEWVPPAPVLSREEALAELARRYFTSHGPATLADFVWWAGLKVADARAGLAAVSTGLAQASVNGTVHWMAEEMRDLPAGRSVHLLPGFDEYLLGYRNRGVALAPDHARRIVPGGNGMFLPTLVVDGRVRGAWKRVIAKGSVAVTASPFEVLGRAETGALAAAAERYGAFLGLPVKLAVEDPT